MRTVGMKPIEVEPNKVESPKPPQKKKATTSKKVQK